MGKRTNINDYLGKRYGRLTIIGEAINLVLYGQFTVHCICDCGNEMDIRLLALKSGNTKSCGCWQKENGKIASDKCVIDLTGKVFGKLTVLRKYGSSNGGLRWLCRCECGSEKVVRGYKLRNGLTTSCGCKKREKQSLHCRIQKSITSRGINKEEWVGFAYESGAKEFRGSLEYKQWCQDVHDRDGWACIRCGSKDNIRAHHLNSYSDFPDQRLSIYNGVTLCAKCHDNTYPNSFHRLYWTHHNTRAQFQEWMETS